MMVYKGQTFCSANCTNTDCFRRFTKADRARVKETKFQVAMADFSKGCTGYQEGRPEDA